jgi:hypothetical protein
LLGMAELRHAASVTGAREPLAIRAAEGLRNSIDAELRRAKSANQAISPPKRRLFGATAVRPANP